MLARRTAGAGARKVSQIMKYNRLGSAGVKVSSLCLGAMTFGEADEKSFMHKVGSDEATAHGVLDHALAAGGTASCSRPSFDSRWATVPIAAARLVTAS